MKATYPITKTFLNSYGQSVVKEQKTRLKSFGKGGGPLENSLTYKVVQKNETVSVNFYGEDYTPFVDKGVEGAKTHKAGKGGKSIYKYKTKMPPTKVFDKWAIRKGLAPRSASGKFLSRESLKFAIAKSIFNKGITPTNFFTIPIVRSEKRLQDGLEKSLKIDIENNIQKRI